MAKELKLYLILASSSGYDVYTGAVVATTSPAKARKMHPSGTSYWNGKCWASFRDRERHISDNESWAKPKKVGVEYLGKAKAGTKEGVVLASYYGT